MQTRATRSKTGRSCSLRFGLATGSSQMSNLRDFLYLDTVRLHSFVSQIQGGIVSEVSETSKQLGGLSAGVNVGLPPLGGKVDASKGKESERQQTIQLTDSAYFDALHRHLAQQKDVIDITASSLQTRETLYAGQFIEMQGIAEPPVLEYWTTQFRSMFDFVNRNFKLFTTQTKGKQKTTPKISGQQLQQFKAILDFLTDFITFSRKDPGRQYVRVSSPKQEYRIWCGLLPDFAVIPLQSVLPTEVRVFGRVERRLSDGEVWKIVDLAQFNQAAEAQKLIKMLNDFSALIGQKQITEDDLQAQYPDIFVTPVAIYR